MPLRGLLYRKLVEKKKKTGKKEEKKDKHQKRISSSQGKTEFKNVKTSQMTPHKLAVKKPESSAQPALIKGRARYWGGHFLYPIDDAEKGVLSVQNGTLTFMKSGLLNKSRSINIPLKKVEWKKVSQTVKDAYPVTCFTLPFKDEKGILQSPVFSVDESPARENFSRFLYDRMTKKK